MKFGHPIVYIENGEEFSAVVLGTRELDDHMGSNNEPLVSLGFFKPVVAPGADGKPAIQNVVGTERQSQLVQFRHDVAHESHDFSEAARKAHHKKYGGTVIPGEGESVTIHAVYPGGRWREVELSTFTGTQYEEEGV